MGHSYVLQIFTTAYLIIFSPNILLCAGPEYLRSAKASIPTNSDCVLHTEMLDSYHFRSKISKLKLRQDKGQLHK